MMSSDEKKPNQSENEPHVENQNKLLEDFAGIIEIRPKRPLFMRRYVNREQQKRTIFLLHGMGGRAEQWNPLLDFLRLYGTVITVDLVGHGEAPKPDAMHYYTFEEGVYDLDALFQQYATEENWLFGHSLGGAWATTLASRHLPQIQKMVLVTPLPCKPQLQIPPIFYLPAFILERLRDKMGQTYYSLAFTAKTPQKVLIQERIAGNKNPMYMLRPLMHSLRQLPTVDPKLITTKTLILVGEFDRLIAKDSILEYYSSFPCAQIEEIKEAGHLPVLENPRAVAELLAKFLADDANICKSA